ncbi:hypothetical protein EG329_012365 [Mollisiaceae sp. DMI_Dod_QoI]|nr:hypothetical protein EG329_012365 [Helotiales sp. DMI_Dod_QoI]
MKLVRISSALVSANEENYNSNFHTASEAPGLGVPSELPQSFARWLPLILRSRNIPLELIQTFILTTQDARLILDASKSSLHTREPNRIYAEELAELATSLQSLNFPPEGLFLRLDACSPKDGVLGVRPLKSTEEIALRLTTSHRATNSILRCVERGDEGIELFFLPYDEKMRTEKEYRAFCAPSEGSVRGVSQYRWHKPNLFSSRPEEEIKEIMRKVMDGILSIHGEILDEVKKRGGEMDKLLLEQGFSFDVMFEEESGRCELIELNSFGARSGCGSCLFHWLKDLDVLYGRSSDGDVKADELEFRISV